MRVAPFSLARDPRRECGRRGPVRAILQGRFQVCDGTRMARGARRHGHCASPVLQGLRTATTSSNGDYIIPFLRRVTTSHHRAAGFKT